VGSLGSTSKMCIHPGMNHNFGDVKLRDFKISNRLISCKFTT
jgi:hypothetical protein